MSETAVKQPLTTADIILRMTEIRDERRAISARDKELIAEWRSFESELMLQLEEQGMTKASTDVGTATIVETILPQVRDWDQFYAHIKENDAFYLLQKSPTAAAFREHHASGEEIPGVDAYTQRKIGLRKS